MRWCKTCPEETKTKLLDELRQSGGIKPGGGDKPPGVTDGAIGFNMFMDDDLQECMDGIENLQVKLDNSSSDSSIHSDDYDESSIMDGMGFIESSGASDRVTCGRNKLFLDTCATHNVMFAEEYLSDVYSAGVALLRQNCNAGSKITNQKGFWLDGDFGSTLRVSQIFFPCLLLKHQVVKSSTTLAKIGRCSLPQVSFSHSISTQECATACRS